jgi:protein subunit release factor B
MKKELLFSVTKKDFDIHWFSGRGAGGQFRNKHQNCVRLKHPESGAYSTGQSHRERSANLREALRGLTDSALFKTWINRKAWEVIEGKKIEEKVEEMMYPENLKVEFMDENNKWIKEI